MKVGDLVALLLRADQNRPVRALAQDGEALPIIDVAHWDVDDFVFVVLGSNEANNDH